MMSKLLQSIEQNKNLVNRGILLTLYKNTIL